MPEDAPREISSGAWQAALSDPAVAIAVCDLQCVVRQCNPAFQALTGLAGGSALLRAAAPESLDGIAFNLRRSCAGETKAFVFRGWQIGARSRFSALFVCMPLPDRRDEVLCLAFRPAGSQLPPHRSFQFPLETIPEAAAVINAASQVLWANSVFRRVAAGIDLQELPLTQALPDAAVLQRARSGLSRDGFWQGEIPLQFGRSRVDLLVSVSPFPGATRRKREWLVLFDDISRRSAKCSPRAATNPSPFDSAKQSPS